MFHDSDTTHPGPATVRVRTGDNDRDRVNERDDCATAGIATIAPAQNHRYVVTAGASAGACTARFFRAGMRRDDGGGDRGATVGIVNAE